jgi:hypothetical protein
MEKKVKKAVHKAAFETARVELKTREYRVEPYNQGFIITMDQGSGFRPCGKFGLWDEPFVYRNTYIAKLALDKFEAETIKHG